VRYPTFSSGEGGSERGREWEVIKGKIPNGFQHTLHLRVESDIWSTEKKEEKDENHSDSG
jgi:hypothetical protein